MRSVLAMGLLLAFIASSTASSAQMLTDPVGDVKADVGGQGAAVAQATAVDLAALNVTETPDGFRFTVKVADLGGDQARPDAGRIAVTFRYDNVTFRADYYRSPDNAAYFGAFYSSSDGQVFQYIHQTTVSRDLASATLWQDIAREDLVGASGNVPSRGEVLDGISVSSRGQPFNLGGLGLPVNPTISDAMPDAGGETGTWTVLYHGQDGVGATLTSPKPFRSSNGEATTYLFQVTAKQTGSRAARFTLATTNLPPNWNVSLPGAMLDMAPESPVTFPVRIAVPFNHVHGAAQSLTLRLQETDNGTAWATLDLGVHYTSIPQPAGHHPTLFLHSQDWSEIARVVNPPLGGSTGAMTMNPLEQDPADTGKDVEGYSNLGSGSASTWTWNICLSPQLAIGIDMNLTAPGSFSVPVLTTRPLAGATLTGQLIHLGPGDDGGAWCFDWASRKQTVLADIAGTAQDLSSNTAVTLTGTVTANSAGDYVPYLDGAQMVLQLVLTTTDPAVGGAGGPFIQPGASLTLPINEYHEAGAATAFVQDANATAPGFVSTTTSKASPAAGPLVALVLGALAVVVRGRKS